MNDLISQFRHQTLDTPKLALLFKLIREVKLAMADRVILNKTNTELYKANVQKKQQKNCMGKQYNAQGARHLNLEEIKRRCKYAKKKQKKLKDRQTARRIKQKKPKQPKDVKN